MDTFFTFLAALCAGISITLLILAFFNLLEMVEIDRPEGEELKRLPLLVRMFLPFVPNVLFIVRSPMFEPWHLKCRDLILMAGYDQIITAEQFVAVRLLSMFTGAALMILLSFSTSPYTGLLLGMLLFIYPMLWLTTIKKKRHLEIQKALPNVLDLLTLSVEAGKDFLSSLRDILVRRRHDALGEELSRTFQEIQLGKQRRDALKEMAKRVQQPDLTAVLNSIIQADELGVSIGQILKIQGDQLRTKRFQRAEKLANEAPIKMLAPVVIFIFPAVFIILLAPIMLQAMKSFSR